jgi:hypothetical protein
MTRVITFMLGRAGSNRPYRSIGISDGHHSITHHQNDPVKIEKVAKIDAHLVETFAYFLGKLKATPDGDGNLLDHSLVMYGSPLGDSNVHNHKRVPMFLAGHANGNLKGNLHVRCEDGTPLANAYLTMLHKLGVNVETFGDSTGEIAI